MSVIRLFTFAHKRPDFIELQVKSFQKYLRDDFELTVFNNATFDCDTRNYDAINLACKQHGITVVDVIKDDRIMNRCQAQELVPLFDGNGEYSNPNIACAYPLCWAWEFHIRCQERYIGIIDSDMFLVESIQFTDYSKDHQLCFVPMTRPGGITYMWNALVLADLSKLPEKWNINWWCGIVGEHSVDVGGQTHFYLQAHPELSVMNIRPERIDDENETGYEFLWLEHRRVLHYLRGSNWNGQSDGYHKEKTDWLKGML